MSRVAPITQASAEKAIKAARKLGLKVVGMTVEPGGIVRIHVGEGGEPNPLPLTGAPKPRDAREKFRAPR